MIRSLRGRSPKISDSAYVDESAVMIGDVEIGANSSVWPGAVIRGDFGAIRIGENTAVEDNAVLHSGSPSKDKCDLVIGNNVHIGHGAVINCHAIGNRVLVGMNATLLQDAMIGNYCILGAGCLVSQGDGDPRQIIRGWDPRKDKGPGHGRSALVG